MSAEPDTTPRSPGERTNNRWRPPWMPVASTRHSTAAESRLVNDPIQRPQPVS
ncbi:hypothetical protein I552_3944 [Mycobacterium xenopi 3993]|nr:hypothetical protein I552_3944 [Mycobacterium xenopi 3993]